MYRDKSLREEINYGRKLTYREIPVPTVPIYWSMMAQSDTKAAFDEGMKVGATYVAEKASEKYHTDINELKQFGQDLLNTKEQQLETEKLQAKKAIEETKQKNKIANRKQPIKVWKPNQAEPIYFNTVTEAITANAKDVGLSDNEVKKSMKKGWPGDTGEWITLFSNSNNQWVAKRRWDSKSNQAEYLKRKSNKQGKGEIKDKSYKLALSKAQN